MKVLTYRYMWKLKDGDQICFKIVSDTVEGLTSFEKSFLNEMSSSIYAFGREYLHEYDCSLVGRFDNLYKEDLSGETL